MNEITIGDKIYVSSKRAAEITGYAKDYVGQLCREGHVDAKMVGRSWYVYEPSIRAHRFGVEEVKATATPESVATEARSSESEWSKPVYTSEVPDLLPEIPVPVYQEPVMPVEESLTDMQDAWREWFERKQQVLATPEIESPEIIEERAQQYEEAQAQAQAQEEEEEELSDEDESEEIEIPIHHIEDELDEDDALVDTEVAEYSAEPVYEAPVPVMVRKLEPVEPPVSHYIQYEHQPEARVVEERIVTKKNTKQQRSVKMRQGSNAPVIALLVGISFVAIAIAAVGSGLTEKYTKAFPYENPFFTLLVGTREFKR